MFISNLSEVEEVEFLRKIRDVFPSLAASDSELSILHPHLRKIITKAKSISTLSYDPEGELVDICGQNELLHLRAESRNRLKAFLIACNTLVLDCNPHPDIQNLKWKDITILKDKYKENEHFTSCLKDEEEWMSLLSFRNYLVVSLQIVKEKNKVLLEMSAAMLSKFCLCMSGGKPSRQVKRRHLIYHDETLTAIKPRNYFKFAPLRYCTQENFEEKEMTKRAKVDGSSGLCGGLELLANACQSVLFEGHPSIAPTALPPSQRRNLWMKVEKNIV